MYVCEIETLVQCGVFCCCNEDYPSFTDYSYRLRQLILMLAISVFLRLQRMVERLASFILPSVIIFTVQPINKHKNVCTTKAFTTSEIIKQCLKYRIG